MTQFEEKYLAAIDLGSAKIGICIAHIQEKSVHIVLYKEIPSEGIQSSAIYIPMLTAKAVKKAIAEAEKELMIQIKSVVVGLPRNDVVQVAASATMQREQPEEYVSPEEVRTIKERALETYPLPNPERQAIYGAVAQSFTIDEGIKLSEREIVGTLSPTLEGNFQVFVGRRQAVQAIEKIFKGTGVSIQKKYFLPEVMAKATLSKEELKAGVALVDIGAGVSSISIYKGNIMRYYAAIPFGGKSVSGDIETECSLDEDLSEKIKKRFGFCQPEKLGANSDKVLQIRLTEPYREITVKYISEIITARYKELVDAILYHIQESGLQNTLRGGIVLTGGAAEQNGLEAMIKELSGYNVRKGYPKSFFSAPAGSSVFCTSSTAAIGMILAANDENLLDCAKEIPVKEEIKPIPVEEPDQKPDSVDTGEKPTAEDVDKTIPKPGGGKGGRKGGKNREDPAQGTLPLTWTSVKETVISTLFKFYDDMNKTD